jgi:hypothetical protein
LCGHFPSSRYGGTITQFGKTIRKFGWDATFVDVDDPPAVRELRPLSSLHELHPLILLYATIIRCRVSVSKKFI